MNRLTRTEIAVLALTVILVIGAHLHWLPIALSLAIFGVLSFKLIWTFRSDHPVPAWLRFALLAGVLASVIGTVGSPVGREGGSALLIALAAMKLLETHARRDARILSAVLFFVTMITFLFSQQMLVTLYALLVAAVIFATLYVLTPTQSRQELQLRDVAREALPLAGRLAVAAVPLSIVTFLFFPRLGSPLWGAPWDSVGGKTGISDRMQPGMLSALWNDDTPVFRVTFKAAVPEPRNLYWRGPVLWSFDGSAWTRSETYSYARDYPLQYDPGSVLEYEVLMEPTEQRWFFPLDLPIANTIGGTRLSEDGQIIARRPIIEPKRFTLRSAQRYIFEGDPMPGHRFSALQLPRAGNPQSRSLADSWRARHGDDARAIANEALTLFRSEFSYALDPPPLMMDRPIDDFLFNTKVGYCEHFSSSFVFLMRAAGVHARVVTGYMGGAFNASGGYLVVRNSDAHAWAEIWIEGEGWIRVDPTGAVAPERVSMGSLDAAMPDAIRWYERGWLQDLANRFDVVSATWRRLVIEFNADRQRNLLQPFGLPETSWRELAMGLTIFGALSLALGVWLSRRGLTQRGRDPLLKAWHRFCSRLQSRGLTRAVHEGPMAFGQRAAAAFPAQATEINALVQAFVLARYDDSTPAATGELTRELARFRLKTGRAN